MKVKIRRIGNGVGFLIPKNILTLMHLKEGDEIELEPKTKTIELTFKKA
ncbi:MAG: hypothetical protein M1354_02340 [Candidatus Marsarchaeota archaeon]|jgi:antitoxin component of MazEF toxin-antitoxin module|nr:hypothetical protein [Candidatus Marsarchaeota archaeon]